MLKKILLLTAGLLVACSMTVSASVPYESFTYSYWGAEMPAPQAYIPAATISGSDLGTSPLSSPADVFVSSRQEIYLVDTGNNRILKLNSSYELEMVIAEFEVQGERQAFNGPQGVFVTAEDTIYVADTENSRIVVLNQQGEVLKIFTAPESEILPNDFVYKPQKLVLDNAGRMYVLSINCNQGIIQLSADGSFDGFIGANKVTPSPLDVIWKRFATAEQRKKMALFVPTEYNNLAIDSSNFIFATTDKMSASGVYDAVLNRSADSSYAPVRKLNLTGTDIMRRAGYFPVVGDVNFTLTNDGSSASGPSTIVDVAVDVSGMFSILDSHRCRVFTYDNDGNLLFVFGGKGDARGLFQTPVALAYMDTQYMVLDQTSGALTVFERTEYGELIQSAIEEQNEGNMEKATQHWEDILRMNKNYDLAYEGIGKARLQENDYKGAMEYFELAYNRTYYSKAFQLYRKEVVGQYFGPVATIVVGCVLVGVVAVAVIRRHKRRAASK